MISNERQWPDHRQPYNKPHGGQPPRPFVPEDTLKVGEVQIERKVFVFALKENSRGRFLRLTEEVGPKRISVIIPSTGLADFKKLLDEMVKASEEIPPRSEPSESDPPPA